MRISFSSQNAGRIRRALTTYSMKSKQHSRGRKNVRHHPFHPEALRKVPRLLVLLLIRLYWWTLSPIVGRSCRFHPTCSRYTATCVERFGALHGSWLGLRRVCRCHPWNPGGADLPPKASSDPARPSRIITIGALLLSTSAWVTQAQAQSPLTLRTEKFEAEFSPRRRVTDFLSLARRSLHGRRRRTDQPRHKQPRKVSAPTPRTARDRTPRTRRLERGANLREGTPLYASTREASNRTQDPSRKDAVYPLAHDVCRQSWKEVPIDRPKPRGQSLRLARKRRRRTVRLPLTKDQSKRLRPRQRDAAHETRQGRTQERARIPRTQRGGNRRRQHLFHARPGSGQHAGKKLRPRVV